MLPAMLTRRFVLQGVGRHRRRAVSVLGFRLSVRLAAAAVAACLPLPVWQVAAVERSRETVSPALALQLMPVQDQQPDTLELLLARIRDLESARDASQARIARLAEALAALQDQTARERADRNQEVAELRETLTSLLDSLAATRTDLNSRMQSSILTLRSEGEARSGTLTTRLDGLADDLIGVETEVGTWQADVYDSLEGAQGEIIAEQERRRAADSRNLLWMAFAAGGVLGVVVLLWRRAQTGASALDNRVERMRSELVQQIMNAKEELAGSSTDEARELLREQLAALERMSTVLAEIEQARAADSAPTPDHDLALAVCNELNRIENNLLAMDPKVRGHKQLRGCVRRVKEDLHVEGYEITELRGKPYDEGMQLEVAFAEDETLGSGERTIKRVNRPEVRYQGAIIQSGSVRVAVGPAD